MRAERYVLPNGLSVVSAEMRTSLVACTAYIRGGGRVENKMQLGVAHFLEHLLFKGSKKYPSGHMIDNTIEMVGGEWDAYTSHECIACQTSVLNKHSELAFDVLSDVVCNPLFEEVAVNTERGVVLQEIAEMEDDPKKCAEQEFCEFLWGESPLGKDLLGRENIRNLNSKECFDYHREYFVPANMALSVAGGIRHEDAFNLAAKYFGALRGVGSRAEFPQITWPLTNDDPILVVKTNLNQVVCKLANVPVGWISYHKDHERFKNSAYLVTSILGGSSSSRFFNNLRTETGFAYDVLSWVDVYEDAGNFILSFATNEKDISTALKFVVRSIDSVLKNGIDKDELEKVKNIQRRVYAEQNESSIDTSQFFGSAEIRKLNIMDIENYFEEHIDPITQDDLMEVAKKLFRREALKFMAYGCSDKIDENVFLDILRS